jgi:outer membrane immunogenic protein
MKRLLICAVAVLGFSGAAVADGMKSKVAPAAPPDVSRWAGRYIGAYVGYADGRATHSDLTGYNAFTGITAFQYDDTSVVGGLTLGYNLTHGGLLVGVESEYGYLGFDETRQHPGVAAAGRPASDSTGSFKTGFYSTTMARLGLYNERMLAYAKVGVAFVDVEASFADTFPVGLILVSGTKEDGIKIGGAVGAGLELALNSAWSAKFEWQRIILSDIEVSALANNGTTFRFGHDAVFDTLKFGLNYKF